LATGKNVRDRERQHVSAPREPFRVLSNEDFARLTTAQRADYIRRAVEALDILRAQMSAEVLRTVRQFRESQGS
jgi:hypothetical protein